MSWFLLFALWFSLWTPLLRSQASPTTAEKPVGGLSAAPPAPTAPSPAARFVVVLDAAHGGDDSGANLAAWPALAGANRANAGTGQSQADDGGGAAAEKDADLAMSVRLRSLLSARGIAVVTTRESDVSLDASRRAAIANHAAAQACLSLHASTTGSGVHLFLSSLSPGEPTRFPVWKTAQSASISRSLKLAGLLNEALTQAGIAVTLGRTALPVIDSMNCPAVALEVAPVQSSASVGHGAASGPDDADYQARIANALATALLEWRSEARQP